MADKILTDLTAAGTLDGTELVYGVQAGNSRKLTTQAIADLGGGSGGEDLTLYDEAGASDTFTSGSFSVQYKPVSITLAAGDIKFVPIPAAGGSPAIDPIFIVCQDLSCVRAMVRADYNNMHIGHLFAKFGTSGATTGYRLGWRSGSFGGTLFNQWWAYVGATLSSIATTYGGETTTPDVLDFIIGHSTDQGYFLGFSNNSATDEMTVQFTLVSYHAA